MPNQLARLVITCCGDVPTLETLTAVDLLAQRSGLPPFVNDMLAMLDFKEAEENP